MNINNLRRKSANAKQTWMEKELGQITWRIRSKPDNAFYLEMKPILYFYRLSTKMMYRISPEGKLKPWPKSIWTIIWFAIYGMHSYFAAQVVIGITEQLAFEKRFVKMVNHYINLMMLSFHIGIPISVITESSKICSYFNKWAVFQEQFVSTTGSEFSTSYDVTIRIFVATFPFTVIGMAIVVKNVIFFARWYHMLVYVHMFSIWSLTTFLWGFSLLETGQAAVQIQRRLRTVLEDKKMKCSARDIYKLRRLWQNLSHLATYLGDSIALTMIACFTINHIIFVTASYGLFTAAIAGDATALRFLATITITGSMIVILIECAHRTTTKVGKEMAKCLCQADISKLDHNAKLEVELFLMAISTSYPDVNLGGFAQINRGSITLMMGTTVTYLVVLLQFHISNS